MRRSSAWPQAAASKGRSWRQQANRKGLQSSSSILLPRNWHEIEPWLSGKTLALITVDGDMRDLSVFPNNTFDLIFHPVSNLFIPDVRPVWQEAYRVLKPNGVLLAGFSNPIHYLFDQRAADEGVLTVRHTLPYSDLSSIDADERSVYIDADEALEFGHTLTDQIGGQLDAGFALTGFYEDGWPGTALDDYTDTFIATRSVAMKA
ncbi:MAG: methyltransferase domain-containing protein [Caldilineaceae bacterium]